MVIKVFAKQKYKFYVTDYKYVFSYCLYSLNYG